MPGGFEKLLRGALRYRTDLRPEMLKQFKQVKDKPEPKAVMFSCVDSRLLITRCLNSNVGDMFVVRNAGNLVPSAKLFGYNSATTEPGVLELGCIINNIGHVVVCGHSDCKAMNALYTIRDSINKEEGGPLDLWLKRHGAATLTKFEQLEVEGFNKPAVFQVETPKKTFQAYIDPENNFNVVDKFSMLNTLQQLQHVASYPFLHKKLSSGDVQLHALWFDIHSGNFFMFSRKEERFLEIKDETFEALMKEVVDKKAS